MKIRIQIELEGKPKTVLSAESYIDICYARMKGLFPVSATKGTMIWPHRGKPKKAKTRKRKR